MEKKTVKVENKGSTLPVVLVILAACGLGSAMLNGGEEPAGQPNLELTELIDESADTEKRAYQGILYFLERGYTPEQSVGIICNFMGEGSKLDPAQEQYGGGPGRGIAQWEGGRRDALVAYAAEQGKPWDDFQLQLDFAVHELLGAESRADGEIRNANTVTGAIAAAVRYYERPRDQSDDQIERRYRVCEPILGKLATVVELNLG